MVKEVIFKDKATKGYIRKQAKKIIENPEDRKASKIWAQR